MDVNITARNIDLTADLKKYIRKRLGKLERIYGRIYECDVILEEEKIRKNVEIILHLKRNKLVAEESSTDFFASIDNAADTIKKRLRRLRGRLSSKKRRSVVNRLMNPAASLRKKPDQDDSSRIIKTNAFAEKPMLPEEAKLELELDNRDFLMFKNADTGEANVLYKKKDGNIGLIEPDF